jgi:hypothetical protein
MTYEIHETESPFDYRLARTPYLVIPKLALQSMPLEWQHRFEKLLQEADHIPTPAYFVLRQDAEFTSTTLDDPTDETSRIREYYEITEDPWANYRYANINDLITKEDGDPS